MGPVRVLRQPFPLVLGLRLHLVTTLHGLPVAFALTGAVADEREAGLAMFTAEPALITSRPGQILIGDKNYYGRGFEAALAAAGLRLLGPAPHGEPARAGTRYFKPLRQIIESVNDTFKGQPTSNATAATPRQRHRSHPAAHPGPDYRQSGSRRQ